MKSEEVDYISMNRASWDERAPVHAESNDYRVSNYATEPNKISNVVRNDRPLLGNISGLDVVHLQCHVGTDSISLARIGAKSVTGLDFSPESIRIAREMAESCKHSGGDKMNYVVATVDEALSCLTPGSFDVVYTGIGALCWLPRIRDWAKVVAGLLKPGGRLFIRECTPMMWTIDETKEGLPIVYPYFEQDGPIVISGDGTYVEMKPGTTFETKKTAEFVHGIGEIITALLDSGMQITGFVEHMYMPWEALPGRMKKLDNAEWQMIDRPERIPHTYTLQAVKP